MFVIVPHLLLKVAHFTTCFVNGSSLCPINCEGFLIFAPNTVKISSLCPISSKGFFIVPVIYEKFPVVFHLL